MLTGGAQWWRPVRGVFKLESSHELAQANGAHDSTNQLGDHTCSEGRSLCLLAPGAMAHLDGHLSALPGATEQLAPCVHVDQLIKLDLRSMSSSRRQGPKGCRVWSECAVQRFRSTALWRAVPSPIGGGTAACSVPGLSHCAPHYLCRRSSSEEAPAQALTLNGTHRSAGVSGLNHTMDQPWHLPRLVTAGRNPSRRQPCTMSTIYTPKRRGQTELWEVGTSQQQPAAFTGPSPSQTDLGPKLTVQQNGTFAGRASWLSKC